MIGSFVTGIKMTIAQVVANIVGVILYVIALMGITSALEAETLEQLASDPSTASNLPLSVVVILVVAVFLFVVVEGAVARKLWNWE